MAKGESCNNEELCTQSTSFRGIRLSPSGGHLVEPFSEANCTCFCVLSNLPVSSSMARGGWCTHSGHVQTNPHLFPQHDALSDDMSAAAAHYSGQPFGLFKDVMLSVLPFKAWSMCNLSRPLKNNAEDDYADMQGP